MSGRSQSGEAVQSVPVTAHPARRAPVGERVALSALRSRLDDASAGVRWAVHPDGVLGRVLIMPTATVATFPLTLNGDVTLSARAMLLPHDWRDRDGAVRAWVTVTGPDGRQHRLWAGVLHSSDRGRHRGHHLDITIPASSTTLRLGIDSLRAEGPYPLTRATWVNPTITDPHALPASCGPNASLGPPHTSPGSSDPPLISVLMPVHDPPPHMLSEAIASVRNQTYPHWELCLVDDGSQDPQITSTLEHHAATDPRIHLTRHPTPAGISAATNAALHHATGDYIALLDHDDALTPDALHHIAHTITTQHPDMIYSDEEIRLNGKRIWAHFKPAWSPDTLRTNGYTCHLGVYRRALVNEVGGFRTEFNGSQDVDMILRLVERSDRVAHIPRILYHWRAHATSTAGDPQAKPYAYVAARNAIAAHLERSGLAAEVGFGPPGLYRVVHRVDPGTSVDLVLAVSGPDGLTAAAASWQAQPHPTWNVILAAPTDAIDAATAALRTAGISTNRITAVPVNPGTDPTTALATAAEAATAEHLLLMQTPAAGLTHDWLTRLLGYSHQPHIAAAGPILLAPDGRIHHAGIALPTGIPLHLLHGTRSSMDKLFGYGTSVYNLSAVSGILATRRTTYQNLGGLDPQYKDLALIDYCHRAGAQDHRTVIVPDARLRATGPDPTTNNLPAIWHLRTTWTTTHTHDPYYNPNYRTDRGDFAPAVQ